jgi:hypothetical protein
MKEYQTYGVEDFLTDEYFLNWVQNPSDDTNSFWQNFLIQYPEKQIIIAKTRVLIEEIRKAEIKNENHIQVEEIAAQVWEKLEDSTHRPDRSLFQIWLGAAAIIAITFGVWLFNLKASRSEEESYENQVVAYKGHLIEKNNINNNPQKIVLPDGTKIYLEKNSKVSYNQDFSGKLREVFLKGEAFFEVTRNTQKPFVVYTDEVTTKVLGTSFRIKAYEQEPTIMVAVKTGKVAVSVSENRKATQNNIVLKPNQQLVYERVDNKIQKQLVPKPGMLITVEKADFFDFEDTPLAEVFKKIESVYGIDIMYDEELLGACELTANLEDESLYVKLDLICRTLKLNYEVIDGQVIVTGEGCKK